jgi:glyoxylase-like metal-dependent hydrolase (beta-lactamase superfamily II)
MKIRKYLLIGGASLLGLVVLAVAGLYALLKYSVLPLQDGAALGNGVTTILTGSVGPIAIGAYAVTLADGSIALIDAGADDGATAIRATLTGMGKEPADVRAIFLTHRHDDHVAGARAFPGTAIYAMESATPRTHLLQDSERVEIGGTVVEAFAIPGHTAGSAAFLVHGVLFLGDSAAGLSDGSLGPNTMMSEDGPRTERALAALAERLKPRRAEIHYIAFGHQGAVEGLDPLLNWAATQSR